MERTFLAVQRCAVPRSVRFTEAQTRESLRIVGDFLRQKPTDVPRRLRLFFLVIDALSLLRGGRPFHRLAENKQQIVLQSLFDSNVPLLRKGFWGLNTLARMGAYGQSSVYNDLSYRLRPTPDERSGS